MLQELIKELNKTETENGDLAFKSTLKANLDLFALGGAVRNQSPKQFYYGLVLPAFQEDERLALLNIFYLADVRGGQGERNFFRETIKRLADDIPAILVKVIHLIPEYTRWDNLYSLVDTKLESAMWAIIHKEFYKHVNEGTTSLLFKWLKSENASSKETKRLAQRTIEVLAITPKRYRKILTEKRAQLEHGIVENKISRNLWEDIAYDKIPSRAHFQYRKAFGRHDEIGYKKFLDLVETGEAKINTSQLQPHDIAHKVFSGGFSTKQEVDVFWKNLPNYVDENSNALVMADVSGSMLGTPMDVSVSLALYFAERNKGAFKDYFMTFSGNPELVKVQGSTIVDKLLMIRRAEWGMNTNLYRALKTILNVAVENKVPQEEIPSELIIISDMQFDNCVQGTSTFHQIKREFEQFGYELPTVVFWNVDARNTNVPVTHDENGVVLVSGFSAITFKLITEGTLITPEEFMRSVLYAPRYQPILEALY